MKSKPKYKYKKGTKQVKYANGTQTIDPNIDPTTLYQSNRDQSTGAMQFNNAQQSLVNRDVTAQKYQDQTNQVLDEFGNTQQGKQATNASIAGAMGSIPGIGTLAAAGYGLGTSAGDRFAQKSYENTVATGKSDIANKTAASFLTPTSSKLMNAKSGGDIVNALVPFLNVNNTTQAKQERAAIEANKRQKDIDQQISKYGAVDTTVQAKQIKKGSSGIYIKPENRGKFNATKKATGKSTEELTHSSNPVTKKRAIFAQNAAKWNKKESGVEALGGGQQLFGRTYYKPKKKDRKGYSDFPNDVIKNKSIMKSGTREIETEGREPIFSPIKKDGTRDLLYYNPSAPTHSQGGVKATVVPKEKYKMKSGDSKLVIPEGAAIVTAKGDMNKKAVTAYKKGDYKTVNKIVNKMPNDKSSKKADGDYNVWGSSFSTPTARTDAEQETTSLVNDLDLKANRIDTPTSSTPSAKTNSNTMSKLGNIAGSVVGLAPTIYNLGKGIFDKPVKTNRRYYTPETLKYKDTSAGLRKDADEQFRVDQENIRNVTGGQGGNYLANQALAQSRRYRTKEAINRGETDRMFDIENQNVGTRNQARMTNLGLAGQYDEMDLANKAKKSEYLTKGLEGLSQAQQMGQLNKNRAKSDDVRLNLIKTGNYTIDKEGNITPKAKKGLKNIKYKMKQ